MATSTAPEDVAGCRHLLLEASSTFLQMANIARLNDSSPGLKVFYSHLAYNYARIRDLLEASTHLDSGVAHQIFECLDSSIPESGIPEIPYTYSTAARLRTLNFHWNEVRKLHEDEQIDFISRWLRPTVSGEEREELDRALEDCVDEISKRQPIHKYKSFEMEPTVKTLGEPKSAVRTAAQSSFDALYSCKKCICPCPHDFGVKLELSTYRQPPKPSRSRVQPNRYKNKSAGGLNFEVFLCMERNWQEVGIHAVAARVGFTIPGESSLVNRQGTVSSRSRIEILCKEMTRMKTKPGQRLQLELTENQLFDMGFEKTDFHIHDPAGDESLMQRIKEHRECFTERIKRILYLIIGYTVLHLHNTSWLQSGWSSANIKFFRTVSSQIPLRPFIETRLDDRKGDHDDEISEKDAFSHPCPVLVSLAVVLLEIYFVKPFNELAMEQNVVLIEDPRGRVAVTDLWLVYYGVEELGQLGCRSNIPEDAKGLLDAIDSCIDGENWEDREGNVVDHYTLKSRIYELVVRPLEAYLSFGFSQIQLDSIDQHARSIDFAHRGRFVTIKRPDEFSPGKPSLTRAECLTPTHHTWSTTIQPGAHLREATSCSYLAHHLSVSGATSDLSVKWNSDIEKKTANFFDDEVGGKIGAAQYDAWKDRYEEVYQKYIEDHLSNHPSNTPIRIAILDTGMEIDQSSIETHDKFKGMLNSYNESRKDLPDSHGHGTFVANVILNFAPDAHLYVVKIADKEQSSLDARIVKNAIDHAVNVWHVDIISMSFGWPCSDFDGYYDLQTAIDRAYDKKVLMFAAASNSGGNLGRAYPASSSHVICVHSTDTFGNRSAFSPTQERDRINIATVGESIQSTWPSLLCDNMHKQYCVVSRSGTSYATPILACIAAFLLQYARLHLSEEEVIAMRRKENMEALLRRCAQRGPDYKARDGYYYVELSLHKHNMFGQSLDGINKDICHALRK